MIQKNRGFTRIVKATVYSYKGILAACRNEAAFRQELVLAVVLIPVALWLNLTTLERVVLIFSVIVVLIVELLNSAIESVVDRVGYEHHELAGRAKDMGSAAVLLALTLLVFVWVSVIAF
ncbi:diacylglycerol kinase [Teredinibacter purpureus]|jgi:diacylglycerol kinase (EC 2.7.1.107)|uniref:diacylglycerol kinase n=1 Tax=Teredinibacter purpureus TaxID=2731756 RepID=UPI0005F7D8C6|nr:diacylglycerol kinase [Teredinibacter purpureus]